MRESIPFSTLHCRGAEKRYTTSSTLQACFVLIASVWEVNKRHVLTYIKSNADLRTPVASTLGDSDHIINAGVERCLQPWQLSIFYFQFSLRGKVDIIWQFLLSQEEILKTGLDAVKLSVSHKRY